MFSQILLDRARWHLCQEEILEELYLYDEERSSLEWFCNVDFSVDLNKDE